jgi:hypothetical protein
MWLSIADTNNVLDGASFYDIMDGYNTNTVKDLEFEMEKEENNAAKERVSKSWNDLLTVIVLLLEVVKTLFYLFQLFVIVHIPYFYVKFLVWVQRMVVKKWA